MSGPLRVVHVNEVAVAGEFALLDGYAAWFLALVIENTPGGLEATLARSKVPFERRAAVLRAHAALGEVGARWRLGHASSGAGTTEPGDVEPRVPSAHEVLGVKEVSGLLGVGSRGVRKLAAAGSLPGRFELGRWVFDAADVTAEVDRRAAKAAT